MPGFNRKNRRRDSLEERILCYTNVCPNANTITHQQEKVNVNVRVKANLVIELAKVTKLDALV